MIGRLAAAKNSAMSRLSGAEPETSTRSRPPRRACSLLKTSFSATAYCALSSRADRLAGLLQRDLLLADADRPAEDLGLGAAGARARW